MKKFSKLACKLITQYKRFAETTDVLSSEYNNVWSFIEEFGSKTKVEKSTLEEVHKFISKRMY